VQKRCGSDRGDSRPEGWLIRRARSSVSRPFVNADRREPKSRTRCESRRVREVSARVITRPEAISSQTRRVPQRYLHRTEVRRDYVVEVPIIRPPADCAARRYSRSRLRRVSPGLMKIADWPKKPMPRRRTDRCRRSHRCRSRLRACFIIFENKFFHELSCVTPEHPKSQIGPPQLSVLQLFSQHAIFSKMASANDF
jgi:hypothetical protein